MRSGLSTSCDASVRMLSRNTCMALIKHRKRAHDSWQLLDAGAEGAVPSESAARDLLVPLPMWRTAREQLLTRSGGLGVWLTGDDDPADIARGLAHFDLMA